jgi:ketosteroid isomerase-like protein
MRRFLIVLLAVFGWNAAMANMHDNFKGMPADFDAVLSAEIQTYLNAYAAAYNRQDYESLLGMWDQGFATPIYMAEEVDPPMHGWQRIKGYFNPKPGSTVLDGIRNEYSDVRANYLSDDLAIATYKLRFDIKVKRQKAMSSWDRVMAVFRRKDGEWKLMAYAEAPMAPGTMVRRMLQDAVPDDFDDYLKSVAPQPD